jgi:DNA-binding transcriptional LysR family regulator
VELRELEAFVAVATELHFGHAAARLHLGTPSLSELIHRLERELGTPLFTRTTRRVVLTPAGEELLVWAKTILDESRAAQAAVRRVAAGEAGTVRIGITPPVVPVLAPHLIKTFAESAPQVNVELQRMWLPNLAAGLAAGDIDVAVTCGLIPETDGIVGKVFCAESLLVGLRPNHRLADRSTVALADLAHDVLGTVPADLFPAWALCQQQALDAAGLAPPAVALCDTDLTAGRWTEQDEVDWVMLIASLARTQTNTVFRPVEPLQLVPFTLQWDPRRANTNAVGNLVHAALSAPPPPGWHTQPGHLAHQPTDR